MEVLIAGDFVPYNRVEKLFEKGDFAEVFQKVKNVTGTVDYSIVNIEAPIVDTIEAKPIEKTGPNLKCSVQAINAIKYAGFDCVTLANNHLNTIIADDYLLENQFQQYVNLHIQSMAFIFEPFQNRIFDFFNSHHLLPSFVSQKKYLKILAFFRCESHRDIMFNVLTKKINQGK